MYVYQLCGIVKSGNIARPLTLHIRNGNGEIEDYINSHVIFAIIFVDQVVLIS